MSKADEFWEGCGCGHAYFIALARSSLGEKQAAAPRTPSTLSIASHAPAHLHRAAQSLQPARRSSDLIRIPYIALTSSPSIARTFNRFKRRSSATATLRHSAAPIFRACSSLAVQPDSSALPHLRQPSALRLHPLSLCLLPPSDPTSNHPCAFVRPHATLACFRGTIGRTR